MKKLLIIILCALSLACSRGLDSRVALADSLMWERPDSALSILESIDTASLTAPSDRARYALLLTQARHKNNIFETDDSLITSAVSYYDEHGPDSCRMLSLFYHAVILENSGNSSTALDRLLPALDVATKLENTYWMARVHELLGDIYYDTYNMNVAISHIKKSHDLFKISNHKLNADYKIALLSRAYNHLGNTEKSIELLDSVMPTINKEDSVLIGYITMSYFRPYLVMNRCDLALQSVKKARKLWDNQYDDMFEWCDIAEAYCRMGFPDSATVALEKYKLYNPDFKTKPEFWSVCASIAKTNHDTELSYSLMDSSIKYDHIQASKALNQCLSFVERDYEIARNKAIIKERIISKRAYLSVSIAIILLLIILIITYLISQKRKKAQIISEMYDVIEINESLIKEISSQDRIISNLDTSLREVESTLMLKQTLTRELLYMHIKTLDILSTEYLEKLDSPKLHNIIISNFTQRLKEMRDDDFIAKLKSILNRCMDNILMKMENQIPDLSKTDLNFITLVLAGFSPRSICLLSQLKIASYYNKLSRLKARINSSGAKDTSMFLDAMTNAYKSTDYAS